MRLLIYELTEFIVKDSPGIYEIFNKVNGKRYVGQSTKLKRRLQKHLRELKHSRHSNKHLQAAFNKYGEDKFSFEPIEYCDVEDLDSRENYYIGLFNSGDKEHGYNIRIDNKSNRGLKWTDEQRKKMQEAINTVPYYHNHAIPKWVREKAWQASRDRIWTDEDRRKHSERMKGIKVKDTTKMCIAQRGENNPSSKLTVNDVKQIKALLRYGKYKSSEIARIYGVKSTTICAIKNGRSWKEINISDDYESVLKLGIERMLRNG